MIRRTHTHIQEPYPYKKKNIQNNLLFNSGDGVGNPNMHKLNEQYQTGVLVYNILSYTVIKAN